jgi:hypothetical protein
MSQLGAPKELGDIDVLAWERSSGEIFPVECKRLLVAHSVREVVQRLEDFKGNKQEKDSLGRHLRRVDWLNKNFDAISKFTGIAKSAIRVKPLLITSEIVPMQFYEEMDFPISQVMTFQQAKKMLKISDDDSH